MFHQKKYKHYGNQIDSKGEPFGQDEGEVLYRHHQRGQGNTSGRKPRTLRAAHRSRGAISAPLRIPLSSEGAETAKKFRSKSIKPKISFTPGVELKAEIAKISYKIEN